MLFSIKNRLPETLFLAALFTLLALLGQRAFDLDWQVTFRPETIGILVLSLVVLLANDSLLHALLGFLFGADYWNRYRALVNHFQPQGVPHFLAAGLLAGAEELFFRGLILQGIVQRLEWGTVTAVIVAGVLFGLMHLIRQRPLLPFALWAIWEGILLGLIYLATGSLLVVCLAHAVHDLCGFAFFAWQRSRIKYESISNT